MKIWTVTTDDNTGHECRVFYTEAAADAAALEACRKDWPKDEGPCPDNWQAAMEVIECGDGLLLWVEEHDISDHPAMIRARDALTQAESVIGKLMQGDLNLFSDRGKMTDAYDAVADAAAVLAGRMDTADHRDNALTVTPSPDAVIVWHEPQDIAEGGEIATHDGINAPDVDPQNPAHVAVIRAWMQHIGPSARDAMNEKFWDWIPRDLISMQREIAESLTADHETAVKLDALHREGFVVGVRDHRINTDFPGAFMVAELYTDDQLPTDDARNLAAIVADDLKILITEAYAAFVEGAA